MAKPPFPWIGSKEKIAPYILQLFPPKLTQYVKSGETTEIEWQNTPITGQIQVTKVSADYNAMNGWPAGTPIPNTVFEMDNLQLEESEYALIRDPQRGSCLYKCGNERYLLQVQAPEYKQALFGTAGGR